MDSICSALRHKIDKHYEPNHYPALAFQAKLLKELAQLNGLKVLDATPVFRNTIVKYIPLLEAGIRLDIGISEQVPYDPQIVEFLKSIGMRIVTPEQAQKSNYDVVLDCAGVFCEVDVKYGYSELTRSGVAKYKNCTKPVFCADSGQIKRIETILGTGESLFRALEKLGYNNFTNKKIVVFGSGKVGTGIIICAKANGATITCITNPDTVTPLASKYCSQIIDYKNTSEVINALKDAYMITTATGNKNAISDHEIAQAIENSAALLANMGIEDEFGSMISESRVLNAKRPLNFILEEPTHLKYIDATMALHNEGILSVLANGHIKGVFNPAQHLEKAILAVVESNGIISKELSLLNE